MTNQFKTGDRVLAPYGAATVIDFDGDGYTVEYEMVYSSSKTEDTKNRDYVAADLIREMPARS